MRSAPRGFGLVEMLVAVTVLTAIMAMVFAGFHRTRSEATRVENMVDERQQARAVVQLIERDVRMTGSGWGRLPVHASDNGNPWVLYAITPGAGNAHDSMRVVGAWSASTTSIDSMPAASSNLKVASVTGFEPNDLVVVTNGQRAHAFQITGIDQGNKLLHHATSSIWNVLPSDANVWEWPSGGYAKGSSIYKIDILSFYVDDTNFPRPSLVRRAYGKPPEVVAYNVDRFRLYYRMQDGTLDRTPIVTGTGVALIDKVRPVVTISYAEPNRATAVDSAWAEVRPRTF